MKRNNEKLNRRNGFYERLIAELTLLYGEGEASSIARIVVEDVANLDERFEEILSRLLQHEPVQYILGEADFYGLKFEVNPHVLIPRQETEELVYAVLESCKEQDLKGKRLLDVGSGSGCIPIVLKKKLPDLEVVSVDISAEALAVARRNAERHQVAIDWRQMDFLDERNWPALGHFELIVSNPPYIDPEEQHHIPPHVMDYEPALALFTTRDPMEFYRALAVFAQKFLKENGKIFAECNEFRAEDTLELFLEEGFTGVAAHRDMQGKLRIINALKA